MNQGEHNRFSECGWLGRFSSVFTPPGSNTPDIVQSVTGRVFVAQSSEAFTHDDDGNMLSDGRFTYTWNGQNRLIKAEEQVCPTNRTMRKVDYAYDHQGRMVWKVVSRRGAEAQSWEAEKKTSYLWEKFNIIAETVASDSATNVTSTFGAWISMAPCRALEVLAACWPSSKTQPSIFLRGMLMAISLSIVLTRELSSLTVNTIRSVARSSTPANQHSPISNPQCPSPIGSAPNRGALLPV